jgi:hypothetical protein
MINDVRLTFTALREAAAPRTGDLAVLRLESFDDVFLGIDADGHPHLLLAHAEGSTPSVEVATLQVGVRTLLIGGQTVRLLDVGCLLESLEEVFDHFLVAVLEHLDEGSRTPAKVVSDVLSRWQLFLTEGTSPSRDAAAAVFGELLVLLDVVRADPQRRIGAWVGPFGARHDFRRGSIAVEVKTTRAHTSRLVTIHGEDQLEEPENGTLYLHLVRLEEVAQHGLSVPSLVDELLSLGAVAEELFEALSRANVPIAQLAKISDVTFDVRERLTLPVDDAMPRIISSSFRDGARPVGVADVTYRIDLDHCLDRAIETPQYEEIMSSLATGSP